MVFALNKKMTIRVFNIFYDYDYEILSFIAQIFFTSMLKSSGNTKLY